MKRAARTDEAKLRKIFKRALLVGLAVPTAASIPLACELLPLGHSTGSTGVGSSVSSGTGSLFDAGDDAADTGVPDPCSPLAIDPPDGDTCGSYSRLPCGLPSTISADAGLGCYIMLSDCDNICNTLFFNCHAADRSCSDAGVILGDDAGMVDVDCTTCPGAVGRVPAGLLRASISRSSPLGDYFARAAHLEAASVHAFARLHDELSIHGAPVRILASVRRAKRDEIRHTRMTASMARRFGGRTTRAVVRTIPLRSLDEVALENIVEGCVRETFGALVATFQATRSRDARVKAMMRSIARDETKHAALSWSIGRWATRHLDSESRMRIAEHAQKAIASLRQSNDVADHPALSSQAGLPTREQFNALLDSLETSLWSTFTSCSPVPTSSG
jgi:hypothetical protein